MKNEHCPVDLAKVTRFEHFPTANEEEKSELAARLADATEELMFYNWCEDIEGVYVGLFYPGIVSVFLMSIDTRFDEVDRWVWVIVGDMPPAYITCDHAPNPACALDGYIGAMKEWAEAASRGESVAQLIPVNVPASPEAGENLMRRLVFLEDKILCRHKDDLAC
ncbi:hypothetical protein [Pseudomonas brassicae]|uniref:hypothetical protein n=1 Tax=Pseudomonas brassicae TaxID=2708063 RepID=UPI0015B5C514|nr:hypothetical protein [Pseudomonas brassicae]